LTQQQWPGELEVVSVKFEVSEWLQKKRWSGWGQDVEGVNHVEEVKRMCPAKPTTRLYAVEAGRPCLSTHFPQKLAHEIASVTVHKNRVKRLREGHQNMARRGSCHDTQGRPIKFTARNAVPSINGSGET
jgi:hypothetical protein